MAGGVTLPGVREAMAAWLAARPAGALLVGFSGGLDSSVLLHVLAAMPGARARGLAAVHVDHGLHADSAAWALRCAAFAAGCGVPLQIERVAVEKHGGLGIEAAARASRYAAFERHLAPGAILALAHHRDDQIETVLLRMLNAAGHEGIAGMRAWRPLRDAWLWRPLLDQPRAALDAYAREHGIVPIDDPSNADAGFARNRLRHGVLPTLRAHWPDADARIAAAAARLREDADALDAVAAHDLAQLQRDTPNTLALQELRALPPALRRRILGRWLDALALPRPPPGIWRRLDTDLLDAREDATPLLAWRGAQLRRYRNTLHALRERPAPAADWRVKWTGDAPITLPDGFGSLALHPARAFDRPITVAPRQGGERILQHGLQRPLRLRLQELGVPPWTRERLPLLLDSTGRLLAAADVAQSDPFHSWLESSATRLRWTPGD